MNEESKLSLETFSQILTSWGCQDKDCLQWTKTQLVITTTPVGEYFQPFFRRCWWDALKMTGIFIWAGYVCVDKSISRLLTRSDWPALSLGGQLQSCSEEISGTVVYEKRTVRWFHWFQHKMPWSHFLGILSVTRFSTRARCSEDIIICSCLEKNIWIVTTQS